jgi:hypothetical protein
MVKVSRLSISETSEAFILVSGITALLALGILENIQEQGLARSLLEMEHNSAEYLHILIEVMRYVLYINFPRTLSIRRFHQALHSLVS